MMLRFQFLRLPNDSVAIFVGLVDDLSFEEAVTVGEGASYFEAVSYLITVLRQAVDLILHVRGKVVAGVSSSQALLVSDTGLLGSQRRLEHCQDDHGCRHQLEQPLRG